MRLSGHRDRRQETRSAKVVTLIMFSTFSEYLDSIKSDGGWLLCVFYNIIDFPQSPSSTQTPGFIDIKLHNVHRIKEGLSISAITFVPDMIGCDWDYLAVAHITSDNSQYDAKNCLFQMCEELKAGKQFMTIWKDGTTLDMPEH